VGAIVGRDHSVQETVQIAASEKDLVYSDTITGSCLSAMPQNVVANQKNARCHAAMKQKKCAVILGIVGREVHVNSITV